MSIYAPFLHLPRAIVAALEPLDPTHLTVDIWSRESDTNGHLETTQLTCLVAFMRAFIQEANLTVKTNCYIKVLARNKPDARDFFFPNEGIMFKEVLFDDTMGTLPLTLGIWVRATPRSLFLTRENMVLLALGKASRCATFERRLADVIWAFVPWRQEDELTRHLKESCETLDGFTERINHSRRMEVYIFEYFRFGIC